MPKPDPDAVDDDDRPLTDGRLASLEPASAVFTADQLAALSAPRGAASSEAVEVRLRISPEALAPFKADGPGWQARMRTALEKAALAET